MVERPSKGRVIQSIDKALLLLETIGNERTAMSLKGLADRLRWDKATLYRMLFTLESRGYVMRRNERKEYGLGLKIYGLYGALVRNLDIHDIARPYLEEFSRKTKETVHLGVPIGQKIVFIDRLAGRDFLCVTTEIGSSVPIYSTGIGKAILAFRNHAEIDQLFSEKLTRYTPKTITAKAMLLADISRTRKNGYATDDEEYMVGVRCTAAPILNDLGKPIASIGLSGPKSRLPAQKLKQFGELNREIARRLSADCGFSESK